MSTVAINATMLNRKSGGIGVYIRKLLEHIHQLPSGIKPKIIVGNQALKMFRPVLDADVIIPLNCDSMSPVRRSFVELFSLSKILSKNNVDLFHSPISYIPLRVAVPSIVTIHDLRYFHFPESYTRLRGKFLERMIPRSLEKAVVIIAISEYTKRDMQDLFGIPDEKIRVIYEGIDTIAFSRPYYEYEWKTIQKKYALPKRYILSAGHLEPRKNYLRLLEAFSILRDKYGVKIALVILGKENWEFEEIYKRVWELGLDGHVTFTGFVEDKELPAFYQNAEIFAAPSLFEGFGFTPLEAQAAGTAVVASNSTSHPEVLADSAMLFDPWDPLDMAGKMAKVLLDSQLRDELKIRGVENIKRFSWSACSKITFELYKKWVVN